MTTSPPRTDKLDVDTWRDRVLSRVQGGDRLAGLYATDDNAGGVDLVALVTEAHGIDRLAAVLQPDHTGRLAYPALSATLPAAVWYERALHDLSGVLPTGHPRLDPLLFPGADSERRPYPGRSGLTQPLRQDERLGRVDVGGHGLFSLPFGPVRSGVFESIEFLLETPGENIPHMAIRPHYKHRGVAKRFEGRDMSEGVLVAERVEGIASVAHALAFCHAVENLAGVGVPVAAQLLRVVHAELERVANHLDVAIRLTDAAGLAVATARFGWHKERVQRLVSRMCGSRFGRGVVVPGGISALPRLPAEDILAALSDIHADVRADATVLMRTASFLDRLRGTGVLDGDQARLFGALGPVGRGSGYDDDDRTRRPTDGYPLLDVPTAPDQQAGDAMARLRVRWTELDASIALSTQAVQLLAAEPSSAQSSSARAAATLAAPVRVTDGATVGWAEAPQGEVLYGLHVADGVIERCFARSASFHNLLLFHNVFSGDVFTDFPFIEASFGLSYAGTAM